MTAASDLLVAEAIAAADRFEPIRATCRTNSYTASGHIIGVVRTLRGLPRVVFEFDTPPGLLHILNPTQLENS